MMSTSGPTNGNVQPMSERPRRPARSTSRPHRRRSAKHLAELINQQPAVNRDSVWGRKRMSQMDPRLRCDTSAEPEHAHTSGTAPTSTPPAPARTTGTRLPIQHRVGKIQARWDA